MFCPAITFHFSTTPPRCRRTLALKANHVTSRLHCFIVSLQRLFIALYGHGFCGYLRNKMFRKILRHGAAYFDEEANTPGRLVHKLMSDTATLNRVINLCVTDHVWIG